MDTTSSEELEKTTCIVCNKEKSITEFYYCLCDSPVCADCISSLKINDTQWKCPKCEQINDLETTRLFRAHD
ncbi:MAG: hypothetical protein ACTSRZ_19815 [Promethearchaeota archaeon]